MMVSPIFQAVRAARTLGDTENGQRVNSQRNRTTEDEEEEEEEESACPSPYTNIF